MHAALLAFFLLGLNQAPAAAPAADPGAIAQAMIQHLAARDFAAAEAQFAPVMQKAAPIPALTQLWDGILQEDGSFVAAGKTRVVPVQTNQAAATVVKFAKASLVLIVVVNPDGKIVGFFKRPAPPPGPPPAAASLPGWQPPAYAPAAQFHEDSVSIGQPPWQLPADWTLPNGAGPFPAVVLVAGSGPEDADETIGPNKPFKDLAGGLAAQGIAVLRYPKRTYEYAAQSAAIRNLTVRQEYVEDADAALAFVAARPEVAKNRIFVLGHSEGGYLVPRIGADARVAGLISLAGSTRPLEQSVVMQLRYLAALHPPRATPAQVAAAEADARRAEDPALREGEIVPLAGASLPASYVLDLRGYDPAAAAAALHKPILILQGGRDYQVNRTDYQRWQAALGRDPQASFHFYPGLTHLFIAVDRPGPASPADYAVAGHMDAGVVRDIAAWIKEQR